MKKYIFIALILLIPGLYAFIAAKVSGWDREFSPFLNQPLANLVEHLGPPDNENPMMSEYYWENMRGSSWTLSVIVDEAGRVRFAQMIYPFNTEFIGCIIQPDSNWLTAPFSCEIKPKA